MNAPLYSSIKSESQQDFERAASFARLALDAETANESKTFHGLALFYWARATGGAS